MSGAQAGGSRGAGDKQALGEADAMRGELSHAAKVLRDLAKHLLADPADKDKTAKKSGGLFGLFGGGKEGEK